MPTHLPGHLFSYKACQGYAKIGFLLLQKGAVDLYNEIRIVWLQVNAEKVNMYHVVYNP